MSGTYVAYSLDQLVEPCRESGPAGAWDEFDARTQGLVAGTVVTTIRRWKVCQSVSPDDVVQEVYLKISANHAALLRRFQPRHPNAILGYLRAVAASVAQDYCKGMNAAKRGSGKDESLGATEPAADISQRGGAADIERGVLIREIDQILMVGADGPNGRRDRNIFWLYYRQGFTASAIAIIPGIDLTVKGVESTIQRLTRMVREHLGSSPVCVAMPPKEIRSESSL